MTQRQILRALLVCTVAACRREVTAPAVPLDLIVSARTIDGSALPVPIEERPGAGSVLTQLTLFLSTDGLWYAEGRMYPQGGSPTVLGDTEDNGSYQFDGSLLVLHSNRSHSDWHGTIRGDTVSVTALLTIANAPHAIVLTR